MKGYTNCMRVNNPDRFPAEVYIIPQEGHALRILEVGLAAPVTTFYHAARKVRYPSVLVSLIVGSSAFYSQSHVRSGYFQRSFYLGKLVESRRGRCI